MSKDTQISQIEASLETAYSISCARCGNFKTTNLNIEDAALYFYEKGWNISPAGEVQCPDCQPH